MASSRAVAYGARRRTHSSAPVATPRRVENRVLDALIGLRLQSDHQKALDWKAKQLGYKTAQDWIRDRMMPEIEQAVAEMRSAQQEESLAAAS